MSLENQSTTNYVLTIGSENNENNNKSIMNCYNCSKSFILFENKIFEFENKEEIYKNKINALQSQILELKNDNNRFLIENCRKSSNSQNYNLDFELETDLKPIIIDLLRELDEIKQNKIEISEKAIEMLATKEMEILELQNIVSEVKYSYNIELNKIAMDYNKINTLDYDNYKSISSVYSEGENIFSNLQINNLKNEFVQKEQEYEEKIDALKFQISELETELFSKRSNDFLEVKREDYQLELDKLYQNIRILEESKQSLNAKYETSKILISEKAEENAKLKSEIIDFEKKYEEIIKNHKLEKKSLEKQFKKDLKNKDNEINMMKNRINEILKENSNILKEYDQFKKSKEKYIESYRKLLNDFNEIQSNYSIEKNNIEQKLLSQEKLHEKEKNILIEKIKTMKLELSGVSTPKSTKSNNRRNSSLTDFLNLSNEIEGYKSKIEELENTIIFNSHNFSIQIKAYEEENQKLRDSVCNIQISYEEQIKHLQTKLILLNTSNLSTKIDARRIKELTIKLEEANQELERLRNKNTTEINEFKKKYQDLEDVNTILRVDFANLTFEKEQLDIELRKDIKRRLSLKEKHQK